MRIGEVGDAVGVSTKTLRFYESIGLLPDPVRTASGYRDYPAEMVERVQFIRDAQAAGLTLAEVTSVLELKNTGHRSCEHTLSLVQRHLSRSMNGSRHCVRPASDWLSSHGGPLASTLSIAPTRSAAR